MSLCSKTEMQQYILDAAKPLIVLLHDYYPKGTQIIIENNKISILDNVVDLKYIILKDIINLNN